MQSKRIMWAALALVLLAGCQKTPQSGQIVRFTAVSQPAVLTKVQYTGDLAGGTKERIDWKQGDKIRIYSEGATASNDPSYYWADYAVTSDGTADGAVSKAKISVTSSSSQGGLTWGSGTNTFYAIYPTPGTADAAATVKGTSGAPFSGSIPAAQSGTAISVKDLSDQSASINVYYPSAPAYHLAYASMSEPPTEATLAFDPAYTAFHVSAGYKDTDMTIKSVTLKAASGNALSGDFTAYRGGSGWTFGCPAYASGSNDAVTFTFAGGNPELSSTKPKVEFVLYALPKELTNLTLDFLVEIAGVEKHRTLELKTAAAGTYYGHTYAAGESLIFNACKKSYIKGLLIPGSTWTIDGSTEIKMQESVEDWEDDTTITPVEYGTSGIIFNATGLNQTGTGGKSFDFSLFAPAGKTWKVTARKASDGSVATGVVLRLETGAASTGGVLSGTIGSPNPWIHFTAESGTSGENYYLTFSVDVDGTGTEYSIDSEVARGGWGPGKSYSYFSF